MLTVGRSARDLLGTLAAWSQKKDEQKVSPNVQEARAALPPKFFSDS